MIKEKHRLTGNLNAKQSLSSKLGNAIIYINPITQEKEITPARTVQEIIPDIGYTGLSKVIVKGYNPNVANKTITTNGIYKATDDNLDGYSEIEVKTNGIQVPDNAHIVFSDYDYLGYITKATIKTAWGYGDNKYIMGRVLCGNYNQGSNVRNTFNDLEEINIIPTDIKTIYESAFDTCTSLKTINLPDSIETIKQEVFRYCQELSNIHLPNNLKGELGASCFYGCRKLEEITIPIDVTKLRYSCFDGCTSLAKVTLQQNIVSIERSCFSGCSKLATLLINNVTQVPTLEAISAFSNTPISKGTGYIYVPDDMVDSFKSATNWSSFADQIKPISEYA